MALTEQYTEEQQDTGASSSGVSGLVTDILESCEEAVESTNVVAPSLIDDTKEVFLAESFPAEKTLDITIEEEKDVQRKDDSEKSTAATTIHG